MERTMGTQFDDFATSPITDDAFTSVDDNAGLEAEDEEQLIRDGNELVLRNIEATKKSGDYARSQTSSNKKASAISINMVDWSGFPGAAHNISPKNGERKERVSLNPRRSASAVADDLERRSSMVNRAPHRLSASAVVSAETIPSAPRSPKSPTGRKYRNRRHEARISGTIPTKETDVATTDKDRLRRREHLKESLSNARAERMNSGTAGRSTRRSLTRKESRSKSRTRRNSQPANRSVSPSNAKPRARAHRSTSPGNRLRRSAATAASSTTLEVSNPSGGRAKQRSCSSARRKSRERPSQSEEALKRATSLRW